MTREKEVFQPIHEGFVGLYVCGPTVYGHAHIGHGKVYITFDVLKRYLEHLGYKVRYVQNITDVGHLTDDADAGEDKIQKEASTQRIEPMEVVESFTRSYFEDMDTLNVGRPDISPRASGHIPEQLELAEALIEKGFAYENQGSVYFSVADWSSYGKLSGRKIDDLTEGDRIESDPGKKDPRDFAVWRAAKPGHIMRWNSPWGEGFPGWHAECTVMARKYLGIPFDIHGGGLENIFPHNESEIAQCEAAYDTEFARCWVLNNMVTVEGTKMGKSLGNFTTMKEAFREFDPMTVRMFILSSHYRSNTDFARKALSGAKKGYSKLKQTLTRVREALGSAPDEGDVDPGAARAHDHLAKEFASAMDDDLNTPQALAALFDYTREINKLLESESALNKKTLELVESGYSLLGESILGIFPKRGTETSSDQNIVPGLVEILIEMRNEARTNKDWATSDAIRDRLAGIGITLEDRAEGTSWRKMP